MNRRTPQQGFTLVELLISLAIFSVLSLLAFQAISTFARTSQHALERQQKLAQLERAFTLIGDDLRSSSDRGIRLERGGRDPALVINANDGDLLRLTRGGRPSATDPKRSNLQRVSYRLDQGRLLRSTWVHLDRTPDSTAETTALLEEINELRVQILTTDKSTQIAWPPGDGFTHSTRPAGIELTITLHPWGSLRRVFEL